jgi:hypothetical protein
VPSEKKADCRAGAGAVAEGEGGFRGVFASIARWRDELAGRNSQIQEGRHPAAQPAELNSSRIGYPAGVKARMTAANCHEIQRGYDDQDARSRLGRRRPPAHPAPPKTGRLAWVTALSVHLRLQG